jgi:hypothetical protein
VDRVGRQATCLPAEIYNLACSSQDGVIDAARISKVYIRALEGHRLFTISPQTCFERRKVLSNTICTALHTEILKLRSHAIYFELELGDPPDSQRSAGLPPTFVSTMMTPVTDQVR